MNPTQNLPTSASPNRFRGAGKLKGLLPVLPTPMNEDESLDERGFESLADFLLRYPFSGVWAMGTAGEDQHLSQNEIDAAARLIVRHIGGKLPVLFKTSHPGTRHTIENTKRMADFGIDAAVILFRQHKLGADHARRYFLEVADASPLPLFIYHNAGRGAQLEMSLMLELSRHERYAGIKAGGYNLAELQRLCLLADPDFSVMPAGGGQLYASLAMGAAAHVALPQLAFPERAFRILDFVREGRLAAAQEEQKVILKFLSRMPKLQNREVNAEVKCVLELRGVIQRWVSAPYANVSDAQKGEFASLIDELDLFAKAAAKAQQP